MRSYKPRRLGIVSGALLLLILAGLPVLLGLTRPQPGDAPGVVLVYTHGLSSLGSTGMVALGLAVIFGAWLLAKQRKEVNRKYLSRSARRWHNTIAALRTLAITVGGASLIAGSLSGLYIAMMQARPDLYDQLALPFVTGQLAVICLVGGGGLYAAGRLGG